MELHNKFRVDEIACDADGGDYRALCDNVYNVLHFLWSVMVKNKGKALEVLSLVSLLPGD